MGQDKKRQKVSASLSIGYKLKTKRTVFSFIVAFVILLFLNLETLASLFPSYEPPSFYLTPQVTNYPTFGNVEIDEYIKRNSYVPNYDADIYIVLESENFNIDDYLRFSIGISDNGIISMEKPCYWFFITNPKGETVSGFPGIGQLSVVTTLNRWNTEDHYNKFYTDCFLYDDEGMIYYIPRKTLIEGHGKYVYQSQNLLYWSDKESRLSFQVKLEDNPLLIGRWRITLFLFDEKYVDRLGEEINTDNMINYQIQYFEVVNKSPPSSPISTGDIIWGVYNIGAFVATYVITYIGIYDKVEKHKDKIKQLKNKIKENMLFTISLLIIIFLIIIYLVRPF